MKHQLKIIATMLGLGALVAAMVLAGQSAAEGGWGLYVGTALVVLGCAAALCMIAVAIVGPEKSR